MKKFPLTCQTDKFQQQDRRNQRCGERSDRQRNPRRLLVRDSEQLPKHFHRQWAQRHSWLQYHVIPPRDASGERTSRNRTSQNYLGIILGFLRKMTRYELLTIKDMAGKTNSNGESLLRYYDPDEERMRANVKMS